MAGKPSTSTANVSPSTVTWMGDVERSPTSTVYHCSPTLMRKVAIANPPYPDFWIGVAPGGQMSVPSILYGVP